MAKIYIINKDNLNPGYLVSSLYVYTDFDVAWKAVSALNSKAVIYEIEVDDAARDSVLKKLKAGDTLDLSQYENANYAHFEPKSDFLAFNKVANIPRRPAAQNKNEEKNVVKTFYVLEKSNEARVEAKAQVSPAYYYTSESSILPALKMLKSNAVVYEIPTYSYDEEYALEAALRNGKKVNLQGYKNTRFAIYYRDDAVLRFRAQPAAGYADNPHHMFKSESVALSRKGKLEKALIGDVKLATDLLINDIKELSLSEVCELVLANRKDENFNGNLNKLLHNTGKSLFDIAMSNWNLALKLLRTRLADLLTPDEMAQVASKFDAQFNAAGQQNLLMNQAGRYYYGRMETKAQKPEAPDLEPEVSFDEAMEDIELSKRYLAQHQVITMENAERLADMIITHESKRGGGSAYLKSVNLFDIAMKNEKAAIKLLGNAIVVESLGTLPLAKIIKEHCQKSAFQIAVEEGRLAQMARPSSVIDRAHHSRDKVAIQQLFYSRPMKDLLTMESVADEKRLNETGWNDKDGDPYDILALDRDATVEDIKKAYKMLAIKLHPDKGATTGGTRFKRLEPAYRCLVDPVKRAAYDQRHPVRRTGPK